MDAFANIPIPFDSYGNILLGDYENYADDQVVEIVLTIDDSNVTGPSWGIAQIVPIGNYDIIQTELKSKTAGSAEGTENAYTFTIAELKEFAKVNGEYWIDEANGGRKGIAVNTYNGAALTGLSVVESGNSDPIDLTFDEYRNILLSEFVNYADNDEVALTITVPEDKVGWGVAKLADIAWQKQWGDDEYTATAPVSDWVVTVGFLKQVAKAGTDEYITDQYERQGVVINVYNDAALTAVKLYVKGETNMKPVNPNQSQVYNVAGGIVVNAMNEKVSVYSIDGRLVKQTMANNSTISLAQGLYIVKVGTSVAVKVLVK
ncbi:hypothetical protein FACS189440_06930 [Bacteroidia bacterium]|nr:hypothetical protein FACS189440_06930 [Bacteroidia bacterium]